MTSTPSTTAIPAHLKTWVTLAFLYVYIAWGGTYMAVHFALQSLPPFLTAGTRFVLAGTVLMGLLGLFHSRNFHWGDLREWRDALVVGSLLLVGGNGSVAWAQQYVNTSTAALIFGSMPLCIIFFDWVRPGGNVPSLRTGIGLAFGFLGVCILITPSAENPDTRMEIWGKLVLVFAACSWSAGAIYSRHVHAKGSPLLPMARQMIAGGLVLLTIAGAKGDFGRVALASVTAASWMGFGYLVVFGSLFGFTAYVWLMRVSTPAHVSTISYVNLVVAVILGWTLGGEPMTLRLLVGASIIVGSVVLVLTKKSVADVVASEPTEA
jgi:drug/metabolite transporter (DMT)-like permease